MTGIRNFIFIGGGLRVYNDEINVFSDQWPDFYSEGFKHALRSPMLMALDLATGQNAFKYIWPEIIETSKQFFPDERKGCDSDGKNCQLSIPYAMSDPVVLDVWDQRPVSPNVAGPGEDGFADYLYMGDVNGVLYGVKLRFDNRGTKSDSGVYVDLWKTKPIPVKGLDGTSALASNKYRSGRQPITVQPTVSIERASPDITDPTRLRVIFGAGKHEEVEGDHTDATDTAKMSLYNLADVIEMPGDSWPDPVNGRKVSGTIGGDASVSGLKFKVRSHCEDTVYRCKGQQGESCPYQGPGAAGTLGDTTWSGCQWSIPQDDGSGNGDCCEGPAGGSSCVRRTSPLLPSPPCWSCIYDLPELGEKVINKPLIAGGVVFFTTFKPMAQSEDPCKAGGVGYLYAFDYMCDSFAAGFNPIVDMGDDMVTFVSSNRDADNPQIYGARVQLGLGVPSQPVLDSSGKYLIVQRSTAEIDRKEVNLQTPPVELKGWREIR
jgi:type IV pilus assembly protein PilY1